MRVSNAMMAESIKTYLRRQTQALLKTQEQIVSGKTINRASDDPIGIGLAMGYRKTISSLEQNNENIDNAMLHINAVEGILGGVTDLLTEAKDIAAGSGSDINPALADQVATIREQVLQLANSKINRNYVFSGDLTNVAPFDAGGVYNGDGGSKDYLIGDGMQISIPSDGSVIFQGASDVFTVLDDLETALDANDTQAIEDQLTFLDDAIKQLNSTRTANAGIYKRLEATQTSNEKFIVTMQNMLSSTEDANVTELAVDLQLQETTYETILAVAAKIVQPSLVDFLS